jgi:putative ABC transport system permease protein
MGWRIILAEAIESLRFYRRRTVITIVSLGWGVASFLILMSYGNGFDQTLRHAFTAVGQDLVLTFSGQTSLQAGGLRSGRPIRIVEPDVAAIKEAVPAVGAISPEMIQGRMVVVRGTREKRYQLRGVRAEYRRIRNMNVVDGRWINQDDTRQRNRVAVLGATVARELFSGIPPVNEEITVRGVRFTVIGVLDTKLQIANYSRRDNECIFVPYDTFSLFADTQYPAMLVWTPRAPGLRDSAIRGVRATLAQIHGFSPNDEKAVEILAFSQFMYIIDGMSLALKMLLAFVGALTLGIGGVGLANIMLASVVERTREIGIQKAMGSRRSAVLKQFLAEALMIVGAGGALGLSAGYALTYAVGSMPLWGAIFTDTADRGNVELHIRASSVLVSTGVLLAVGIIAGMVPAVRAARMDPVEALRYE